MKLGARILKTGIAIILALYVAKFLHIPSPVFAGIAAIFAIQPTIYRSYLTVVEQVQGNIIGTIIAASFVLAFGNDYLFVGLAAIVTLVIMVKLKLENAVRLALVTVIAVMEAPGGDFLQFAALRSSSILLGILSAFIVNMIFLPPKHETRLFQNISDVTEDILKWMRLTSRFASEEKLLKKDIGTIKDRMDKVNLLYTMFKEERRYFKKHEMAKHRKLVIYRQMTQVTQKSFEVLKLQNRYEHILNHLPDKLQIHIQNRLDYLVSYHEQLLMKFLGRVRSSVELDEIHDIGPDRHQLMETFIKEIRNSELADEFQPYHLMHILSAIVEYEEQLEHLDILITSFQTYHKKDNIVKLKDTPGQDS